MVSPKVVEEIDSRLGVVEEVEKRLRQDALIFFYESKGCTPYVQAYSERGFFGSIEWAEDLGNI